MSRTIKSTMFDALALVILVGPLAIGLIIGMSQEVGIN